MLNGYKGTVSAPRCLRAFEHAMQCTEPASYSTDRVLITDKQVGEREARQSLPRYTLTVLFGGVDWPKGSSKLSNAVARSPVSKGM